MTNYSKLYWLTRLDNIQCALFALVYLSSAIYIVYQISKYISCYDKEDRLEFKNEYGKYANVSLFTSLICGFILVFMPSKKDFVIIYAGGKTLDYVQSDTSLAKIPHQTTAIITEYLDKSLKEIKNENK